LFDLNRYKAIVFDCDGVILDSNRIKTNAFRNVARKYGDEPAEALVDYHVQNGGVSRYRKFEYFISEILGREINESELNHLTNEFAEYVTQELLKCPVTGELERLREKTIGSKWFIVSGGDQEELRRVFNERGLLKLFDGGVYGSPKNKDEILAAMLKNGSLKKPALFLGDSHYDHKAAKHAGLDFVFVYRWSEFSTWKEYCNKNGIHTIDSVNSVNTI